MILLFKYNYSNLQNNKLTQLPNEIGNLKNIRTL